MVPAVSDLSFVNGWQTGPVLSPGLRSAVRRPVVRTATSTVWGVLPGWELRGLRSTRRWTCHRRICACSVKECHRSTGSVLFAVCWLATGGLGPFAFVALLLASQSCSGPRSSISYQYRLPSCTNSWTSLLFLTLAIAAVALAPVRSVSIPAFLTALSESRVSAV